MTSDHDSSTETTSRSTWSDGVGALGIVAEIFDVLAEMYSAARKATPQSRAELRNRVIVAHSLAYICNRQGRRARYIGIGKNVFDLCRYAVVENCFAADRLERAAG